MHLLEHRDGPCAGLGLRASDMGAVGLGDLVTAALDRVERELGILQDHRHALAAHVEHLLFGRVEKVDLLELHPVGGDLGGVEQAHDRPPHGRFSRAAFADDAEPLAPEGEAHVPDRGRRRPGIADREPLNVENRVHELPLVHLLGIERVAQAITQKVEGEADAEDRDAREGHQPPAVDHVAPPGGDHRAPFRQRRLRAEAQKAEPCCGEDHRRHVERQADGHRGQAHRHNALPDDPRRRRPL